MIRPDDLCVPRHLVVQRFQPHEGVDALPFQQVCLPPPVRRECFLVRRAQIGEELAEGEVGAAEPPSISRT
jgi:hypothetical protein